MHGGFFGVIFWIIILVVNISFAIAVYKKCEEFEAADKKALFVDKIIWLLATLGMGLAAVFVFWLMHDSTLVKED